MHDRACMCVGSRIRSRSGSGSCADFITHGRQDAYVVPMREYTIRTCQYTVRSSEHPMLNVHMRIVGNRGRIHEGNGCQHLHNYSRYPWTFMTVSCLNSGWCSGLIKFSQRQKTSSVLNSRGGTGNFWGQGNPHSKDRIDLHFPISLLLLWWIHQL